jgi:hypothetical protein
VRHNKPPNKKYEEVMDLYVNPLLLRFQDYLFPVGLMSFVPKNAQMTRPMRNNRKEKFSPWHFALYAL